MVRLDPGNRFRRFIPTAALALVILIIATVGYYTTVSMTLNAFVVPTAPGQATPFPKRGT